VSGVGLAERLLQYGREQNAAQRASLGASAAGGGSSKNLAHITPAALLAAFQLTEEQLMEALNKLAADRCIDLFVIGTDVSFITFFDDAHWQKLRTLSDAENKCRLAIEACSTSGVWARDLRKQLQMPQSAFTKALKALEQRDLIKSFKPVNNKSKKMYISADLTPAVELTGGPWYGPDGEFDSEFANLIGHSFLAQIRAAPRTVDELIDLCAGVSNEPLTPEIATTILNTLVCDGVIRQYCSQQTLRYVLVPQHIEDMAAPCDRCPYFGECSDDNPKINPRTCLPFREWFRMRDDFSQF
jgi:hypothetical protein